MALLISSNDAEAPAAGMAPPQNNLVTTVQVAARKEKTAEWRRAGQCELQTLQASGVLRRKRQQPCITIYSFIKVLCLCDAPSPLYIYLGRPSHMTHEGDQLASKSLSWVWGSSSSWSCSSTMLTSSTRSWTEGEAALAFKVPTASLWLRYVKSCPLILSRTSPGGARRHSCCWWTVYIHS